MKAKEAIAYLNKPVTFKNNPQTRLKISGGVYILTEIQQNWRMDADRRVCTTISTRRECSARMRSAVRRRTGYGGSKRKRSKG